MERNERSDDELGVIYNKVPVQSGKKKFHYLNYFFSLEIL